MCFLITIAFFNRNQMKRIKIKIHHGVLNVCKDVGATLVVAHFRAKMFVFPKNMCRS
jgi:hypothetical protein